VQFAEIYFSVFITYSLENLIFQRLSTISLFIGTAFVNKNKSRMALVDNSAKHPDFTGFLALLSTVIMTNNKNW
jgi:hypothetical protein